MEEKKGLKKITRRTKGYIKEAIEQTGSTNRFELCEYIAAKLEENFKGDTLDYQLKRMQLETTKEILAAIDTYMYKYAKNDKVLLKNDSEE